jgi:hypothetical protein
LPPAFDTLPRVPAWHLRPHDPRTTRRGPPVAAALGGGPHPERGENDQGHGAGLFEQRETQTVCIGSPPAECDRTGQGTRDGEGAILSYQTKQETRGGGRERLKEKVWHLFTKDVCLMLQQRRRLA